MIGLLAPFGVSLRAWSEGVPLAFIRSYGAEPARSLENLFAEADVVFEVEALRPKTRHSVDNQVLARLKDGAVFVNVGRGAVVDETALVTLALTGRVQIALDVYEVEPLPADSPLRGLTNVTLLPHAAGPTSDQHPVCGAAALENLRRYLRGEPLQHLVTHELYTRST